MIRMTTYNGIDDGAVEEFADIAELTADLEENSNSECYKETVLAAFREGAVRVAVANGKATDVYEVIA